MKNIQVLPTRSPITRPHTGRGFWGRCEQPILTTKPLRRNVKSQRLTVKERSRCSGLPAAGREELALALHTSILTASAHVGPVGAGTGPCEAPVSPATETMWGRHGGQERQGAQRQVVRGAKAVGVGGVGCPRWEDK